MVLRSNSKFSAALMSFLLAQIARSLGALLDCFCFFHLLRLMFSSDERVGRRHAVGDARALFMLK